MYELSLLTPDGRSRAQRQFLHAPVEQFSDVKFIFRGARDFVNPSKLLGLMAGLAEIAEQLAIERQLVNAARERVGEIDVLRWTAGNADGPGRARRHRSCAWSRIGSQQLLDVRRRTHPRLRIRRDGRLSHVDFDLADELVRLRIDNLDAAIATIGDVDVALGVVGDRVRRVQLPEILAARLTE